jgi:hypothetical protein
VDDYLKVLLLVGSRFEQAGIPYMLSGSTAMNFYARPRMTRDVDLVVELVSADVERMLTLFQEDFSIASRRSARRLPASRSSTSFIMKRW